MNTSKISRIMLGVAAAACAGVFAARRASGSTPAGSVLWIGAAILLGVLAIALRPKEEKQRSTAITSAAVMVAALMMLSYSLAKIPSREQEAYTPDNTAAPTEFLTETPTEAVVDTEIPTEDPTADPTEELTEAPTAEPTEEPTPEPTPTPAPTPTPSPKPTNTPKPEVTWHGSGMYKVGKDIPEGEYFIKTTSDSGYFAITKDSSGSLDSIIANDLFSTFVYVTVKKGEYLEVSYAKFTDAKDAPDDLASGKKVKDGMYKIGRDLPAGEYKVYSSSDYGYFCVYKNSRHRLEDIVTNSLFEGSKYVKVKNGQYLYLNDAYIKRG